MTGSRLYEKAKFLRNHGRWPNTSSPRTFSEYILQRKLSEAESMFSSLADKVQVRDYVANLVGPHVLIPSLGHWSIDDLNTMPLFPRTIIKCANRSGGIYFSDQLMHEPRSKWVARIQKDLRFDFSALTGETWYSGIPQRVLVEELITDKNGKMPDDYKFFVFNGKVALVQVDSDRFNGHRRCLMSPEWEILPVEYAKPHPEIYPQPPRQLAEMKEIAEKLAGDLPFVRVDLYAKEQGDVLFGEITLAPESGLKRFNPSSYDRELGRRLSA